MARYLLDTNILLRKSDLDSPFHDLAEDAVAKLFEQGHRVCITGQNIVEFWAVATRPVNVNGLGWSHERTCIEVDQLLEQFQLLEETPNIFQYWLSYVRENQIRGKRVHDARLIAVMMAHGVTHLLTFNVDDFESTEEIAIAHPQTIVEE